MLIFYVRNTYFVLIENNKRTLKIEKKKLLIREQALRIILNKQKLVMREVEITVQHIIP